MARDNRIIRPKNRLRRGAEAPEPFTQKDRIAILADYVLREIAARFAHRSRLGQPPRRRR